MLWEPISERFLRGTNKRKKSCLAKTTILSKKTNRRKSPGLFQTAKKTSWSQFVLHLRPVRKPSSTFRTKVRNLGLFWKERFKSATVTNVLPAEEGKPSIIRLTNPIN